MTGGAAWATAAAGRKPLAIRADGSAALAAGMRTDRGPPTAEGFTAAGLGWAVGTFGIGSTTRGQTNFFGPAPRFLDRFEMQVLHELQGL
jgi:hypothetical protein